MHVKVDHQQTLQSLLLQQHPCRDRQVVEDAEPTAEVREGVMGAASQMASHSMLESQTGREQGPTHGEPGALHQRRRGRQTNAALRLPVQLVASKGLVIATRMHQFQPAAGHGQRAMHLSITGQPHVAQTALQLPELGHRKTMGAGKRRAVGLVIDERGLQRFMSAPGVWRIRSSERRGG